MYLINTIYHSISYTNGNFASLQKIQRIIPTWNVLISCIQMGKSLVQLNLWELQANRATFQHQIFKMEPGPTRIKYSQWNLKTGPGRIKNLNPGIFRCRIVRDKSACLRLLFGFASVSAFVKLSQILGSQGTAELWPRFWIFGNRFKVCITGKFEGNDIPEKKWATSKVSVEGASFFCCRFQVELD